MTKFIKYSVLTIPVLLLLFLSSCKDFLNPVQELEVTENELFDDWYEYRSIEMGLYGLQQNLVEQLVVLGELRADLLTITENAEADLVEIYNFNFTEDNKYASPTNFFKLISASNNFIRVLKREHPEVLDPDSPVTNYDKLFGEALCMRAWAYFNAVRIYGKVPYIEESLVTMEEIEEFINTPETYIDSVYIDFAVDGYYNDTLYNQPITLEKKLMDMEMVLDRYINQLENDIKPGGVGVNHYINNNDNTWEITVWNIWAHHALLGQLYLYQGDLAQSAYHFEQIIYNSTEELRYQLTSNTGYGNWGNIFTDINNIEHIFTVSFNKSNWQQNEFQDLFSPIPPHKYMLKPSRPAVIKWEGVWTGYQVNDNNGPSHAEITFRGTPGDGYRGYGTSYAYLNVNTITGGLTSGSYIDGNQWMQMLNARADEDYKTVNNIMEGFDTIVWKFNLGKSIYDQDADFIIYRAGGIHLYLAEVYTWWTYLRNGMITPFVGNAANILNNGKNYSLLDNRLQRGVRGRVGLGEIQIYNIIYQHDPFTNEVIGYRDLTDNLFGKQRFLEEQILEERARELAFEGERFYDLIRVAKRKDNPAFLAEKVAAKYPVGKREQIYNFLLDEYNWYIHFFD